MSLAAKLAVAQCFENKPLFGYRQTGVYFMVMVFLAT